MKIKKLGICYSEDVAFEERTQTLEILSTILNTDIDNLLFIIDGKDEDGEWVEEIYELSDIGLPENEGEAVTPSNSTIDIPFYWKINIPKIGLGIFLQDAGPGMVVVEKNKFLASGIKYQII